MSRFLEKLGFKLGIIEAELNLLDAYKNGMYFNKKFTHHYYSSRKSPKTLSYCIEYLSHRIFGEYVLGVSHMPYAEDFAHFGQKD